MVIVGILVVGAHPRMKGGGAPRRRRAKQSALSALLRTLAGRRSLLARGGPPSGIALAAQCGLRTHPALRPSGCPHSAISTVNDDDNNSNNKNNGNNTVNRHAKGENTTTIPAPYAKMHTLLVLVRENAGCAMNKRPGCGWGIWKQWLPKVCHVLFWGACAGTAGQRTHSTLRLVAASMRMMRRVGSRDISSDCSDTRGRRGGACARNNKGISVQPAPSGQQNKRKANRANVRGRGTPVRSRCRGTQADGRPVCSGSAQHKQVCACTVPHLEHTLGGGGGGHSRVQRNAIEAVAPLPALAHPG